MIILPNLIAIYEHFEFFEYKEEGIDLIKKIILETEKNKHNTRNEMKYKNLIEKYYSKKTNQNEELYTAISNSPQLSNLYNKIKELDAYYKKQPLKKMDDLKKSLFTIVYTLRRLAYLRKLEIIAVKERVFLKILLPLDESNEFLDILEKCVEYFSKQGMTNADILIKCSTGHTSLNIANTNEFLPMIDYEGIFWYFFNTARKLP
jgi:hypothetical protein